MIFLSTINNRISKIVYIVAHNIIKTIKIPCIPFLLPWCDSYAEAPA